MTLIRSVVGLIIILVFASTASAEFYRYVDQHGNVIYTDDLSKVPEDQRDKVRQYENSPEPVIPKTKEETDASQAKVQTDRDELEDLRQQLQTREKTLNKEYKELMKIRKELNEERSKAVTKAQRESYNQRIVEFNTRIQDYEKQRDALAVEVDAFNKKAEERSSETKKP
jgi:DNA repair exonuclease SbcCD ATPase subunit